MAASQALATAGKKSDTARAAAPARAAGAPPLRAVPAPWLALTTAPTAAIQRCLACGGTCSDHETLPAWLRRKEGGAGGGGPDALSGFLASVNHGGRPLESGVRAEFEGRLGSDLANVRVHTGGRADAASRALSARAFALGRHVAFAAGQYDPGSDAGRRLLAHELAHTLQPAPAGRPAAVSSPGDASELEADRVAEAALAGGPAPAATQAGAAIRRQDDGGVLGSLQSGLSSGVSALGSALGSAHTGVGSAVSGLLGSSGAGSLSVTIPISDIHLFDELSIDEEIDSFKTPDFPLAEEIIGDPEVGLFVILELYARAEGSLGLQASLGPGTLRDIRVDLDFASGVYRGSAELNVPATGLIVFDLTGTLGIKGDLEGVYTLGRFEGGLEIEGSAGLLADLSIRPSITYNGGLSFSTTATLDACEELAIQLNAFIRARLLEGFELEEEITDEEDQPVWEWEKWWELGSWIWRRCVRLIGSMRIRYHDGEIEGPDFDWDVQDFDPEALVQEAMAAGVGPSHLTPPLTAKKAKKPTVTFRKSDFPNIAPHIKASQPPVTLHRETDPAEIRRHRQAACGGFTGPGSCDEYPFASSKEGGAGARVKGVPLSEQRKQGGTLSSFYQREGLGDGDAFTVRTA